MQQHTSAQKRACHDRRWWVSKRRRWPRDQGSVDTGLEQAERTGELEWSGQIPLHRVLNLISGARRAPIKIFAPIYYYTSLIHSSLTSTTQKAYGWSCPVTLRLPFWKQQCNRCDVPHLLSRARVPCFLVQPRASVGLGLAGLRPRPTTQSRALRANTKVLFSCEIQNYKSITSKKNLIYIEY